MLTHEIFVDIPRDELKGDGLPRPYQRELIDRFIGSVDNYVCVLPTGAGKTLVAIEIAKHMHRTTKKPILFIAETISLVIQQARAFHEHEYFNHAVTVHCSLVNMQSKRVDRGMFITGGLLVEWLRGV